MRSTNVTGRVAHWSAAHPWRAVAAWVALVALAVGLGAAFSMKTPTQAQQRIGESGRAAAMIQAAGLQTPDTEYVLIHADRGSPGGKEAVAAARQVADRAATVPVVAETGKPVWSADRHTLMVPISLKGNPSGDDVDVTALQRSMHKVSAAHPDLRIAQNGSASVNAAVSDRVSSDLGSAEMTSLPVTLGIMLVVFGALIAAGLPVLLALSSVMATMGLIGPVSRIVPMDETVTSMILLIGMAVGVDYCLFYLKRERQERRRGAGTLDAVAIAAETSGHSIVVSGTAVIACMAGLFAVGSVTFNSLATGAILVVAIAVAGSLTVLPALLVLCGRKVDRPRVPLLWRLVERMRPGAVSGRILRPVLKHPGTSLVAAALVMIALAVPAAGMKMQQSGLNTLPRDIPAVATMHDLRQAFPGDGAGVEVVVAGTSRADTKATLDRVADAAVRSGDWRTSGDQVRLAGNGTGVLALAGTHPDGSDAADTALRTLRQATVPQAARGHGRWAVGGSAAEDYDFARQLADGLPKVLGIVFAVMLVMMTAAFRSVVVAGVSILLNVLSVAATFGVVTLVFQPDWAQGVLDFHSTGGLISWIPVFLFVVLMGLSMDYHVFVLSRVREHMVSGMRAKAAVGRALEETAGVVTSAAVVMVSVFALFATLSMIEMKEIGVGLSIAILLDATLVRLVLLPAALVLLGDKAWGRRSRRPKYGKLEACPVQRPHVASSSGQRSSTT